MGGGEFVEKVSQGTSVHGKFRVMGDVRVSLFERFRRSEDVVARKIASEFILVPIVRRSADLDSIFDLNGVGAFIWERLDGHMSGQEIVRALTEEFDVSEVQAAGDYRVFLEQLSSIGVVVRTLEAFSVEEV
jgi:hypothetical protein